MKIGHHEYFLRSSETFYEVLEIARVNSYVQKEVMVKYEYAKIQAKCSSQYVEADLNKKFCSSLKTTTAWKGIPYKFKITIN